MLRYLFFGVMIFSTPAVAISQSSASPDQPVRFDPKRFHSPTPVFTPEAVMPDEARVNQRNGVCMFSVTIDLKGTPRNLKLLRCSDRMFVQNSFTAARQYRFKPARRLDNDQPVAVIVTIAVNFMFPYGKAGTTLPSPLANLSFFASPDSNATPGADGIYPLSKGLGAPRMTKFVGKEFMRAAEGFPDGSGCKVELTVDTSGNATDARAASCDDASMEQPAIEALRASQYTPGTLNGNAVPIRATVHLTYDGFLPPEQRSR